MSCFDESFPLALVTRCFFAACERVNLYYVYIHIITIYMHTPIKIFYQNQNHE